MVIVDPPRTGLGDELIDMLKRVQPKTIVMCHVIRQHLRKLKRIDEKISCGLYSPVDMFHKRHTVEAVVRLVRQDRKKQR